jgi:hypothetical protein
MAGESAEPSAVRRKQHLVVKVREHRELDDSQCLVAAAGAPSSG